MNVNLIIDDKKMFLAVVGMSICLLSTIQTVEAASWWDVVTYPYGYEIHSDATVSGMPISINDTDGVGVDNIIIWTKNASTEPQWLVSTGTGTTGEFAVGTAAVESFWENESNMTGYNPTSVWDDNYMMVLHGDNITANDSTLNHSLLQIGSPTITPDGVFGNAFSFSGVSNNYYNTSNMGIFEDDWTIEFWINQTVSADIFPLTWDDENEMGFRFDYTSYPDKLAFVYYEGGESYWLVPNDTLELDAWYYVALKVNNSNNEIYYYLNGTLAAENVTFGFISPKSKGNSIGAYRDGTNAMTGGLDEIRISNIPRSEEYITANWLAGQNSLMTLGAEEVGERILTTLSPDNITYATTSITINASTTQSSNVTWSEDGGANQTMRNASTEFENTTTLAEGTHDIFIYSEKETDDTNVDSNQTFFTIDLTAPVITLVNPTGTNQTNATIPLDYIVSDAFGSIDTCMYSLNNATNITLAACANTTLAVTQSGTHNISVYVNDTAGWENVDSISFAYDPLQNFTANNSISGEQILDFQVLIVESGTSGSTANGTAPILSSAVGYGVRTVRFISSDYNTTDFLVTFTNESLLSENFTLVPASISVHVYDESDLALGVYTNITFNITITNDTQSSTWYNESSFFKYINETPTGEATIDISSYNYQSRRYYKNINENTANNITGFLLKTSDALYVRFNIRTITENPIEGALLEAQRFLGASWQVVGQQYSDEAGTAAIHLNPFSTYRINVTATGYISQLLTLQPSNTDYRIYLQSTAAGEVWETRLTNITMTFTPTITSLNATITNFVCWVTASDDSLDFVAFNITSGNGTVLFNNLTATASGAMINSTLDLRLENDTNMTAVCLFQRVGYDPFNATRTYFVFNQTGGSLESGLQNLRTSGFTSFTLGMVSIIISVILAGGVTGISRNGFAGAMVGALVLAICTFYLNWFDWKIYLLMVTTLGAFLIIRGQGGVR